MRTVIFLSFIISKYPRFVLNPISKNVTEFSILEKWTHLSTRVFVDDPFSIHYMFIYTAVRTDDKLLTNK